MAQRVVATASATAVAAVNCQVVSDSASLSSAKALRHDAVEAGAEHAADDAEVTGGRAAAAATGQHDEPGEAGHDGDDPGAADGFTEHQGGQTTSADSSPEMMAPSVALVMDRPKVSPR